MEKFLEVMLTNVKMYCTVIIDRPSVYKKLVNKAFLILYRERGKAV
ncbi:hypothetical protein J2Z24_003464 [Clostridium tetanomorphum]|uniref:Uncharacterized protein n=1 Tax=Clostridium tetanomorphum TaxID=1553 RepID=A0A923EDP6_CLOTT|nr:hypothetical protein [Clostridium tetanomorphum]MBP1865804.1 hypothetical protein [Clostridium tetanomorphum]